MHGAGGNEKQRNATLIEALGDHEKEQKGKQENHKNTVVGASESMTQSCEHDGSCNSPFLLLDSCYENSSS